MSNIDHICFFQLTWDKFIISHIIIFSFSSHETSLLFLILLYFLSAHIRQVYYFSYYYFFFQLTWDKFIISLLSAHMRQVYYFSFFFLSAHMRQVYYFSSFFFISHETSLLFLILLFFFQLTWNKWIIFPLEAVISLVYVIHLKDIMLNLRVQIIAIVWCSKEIVHSGKCYQSMEDVYLQGKLDIISIQQSLIVVILLYKILIIQT